LKVAPPRPDGASASAGAAGRLQALAWPAGVLLGALLLWQGLVWWFEIPPFLLPGPLRVAQALAEDAPLLLAALGFTLKVTLWALAAAVLLGVMLAFAFVQSRRLEAALFPFAVLLQVTPLVAIAPLVIIWVREPTTALVVCATVVALFPMVANTTLGLKSVSPALLDYFRLQRATRWQVLWRLRLPAALPYFFGGLRISSGLALIGAVVAEFVAGTGGAQTGLAYEILQAGYQLNIPRMFAALVLIGLAGVGLFLASSALARWALRGWHDSEQEREVG